MGGKRVREEAGGSLGFLQFVQFVTQRRQLQELLALLLLGEHLVHVVKDVLAELLDRVAQRVGPVRVLLQRHQRVDHFQVVLLDPEGDTLGRSVRDAGPSTPPRRFLGGRLGGLPGRLLLRPLAGSCCLFGCLLAPGSPFGRGPGVLAGSHSASL
jgi:hypothetical protein